MGTFQKYFKNCPLITIPGRNFSVDIAYLRHQIATPVYEVLATRTAINISSKDGPGDILVFAPGEEEVRRICELIRESSQRLEVRPLYSTLPYHLQKDALAPLDSGARKVIVATNIAETSLTIPGVVYVIDTGLAKVAGYNPRLKMHTHETQPISKSSGRQRAGRAGHTRNEKCYCLDSEEDRQESMADVVPPEILRSPLHSAVLNILRHGPRKIVDFDWLTPPHPDSLARAARDLEDWSVTFIIITPDNLSR